MSTQLIGGFPELVFNAKSGTVSVFRLIVLFWGHCSGSNSQQYDFQVA
jgi:hypothetical protein